MPVGANTFQNKSKRLFGRNKTKQAKTNALSDVDAKVFRLADRPKQQMNEESSLYLPMKLKSCRSVN